MVAHPRRPLVSVEEYLELDRHSMDTRIVELKSLNIRFPIASVYENLTLPPEDIT
jgi:hypothetical protein